TAGTPETNDRGVLARISGDSVIATGVVVAVAQVDTVTLTGTGGTATITGAGESHVATFDTDLATTASDFVNDYAADYDAAGVTLTSNGADLIFTAEVAGTGFASPTVTTLTGDLAGTVVNTTAN